MSYPLVWPKDILPPQSIMFARGNMSRSGGQSVLGQEQVVVSSSDRWKARLVTKLTRMDQVLRMRALMAESDGRAGTWLVPTCSGTQSYGPTTFSDTSTFSDGSTFGEQKLLTGTASAQTKGARSLTVAITDGEPPPSFGQYFSIGHALYVIVSSEPHTGVAGSYDLTFRPGLRAAASNGDVVDFSDPRCLMRLASDDTGQIDLELLRFAPVTLDFVEASQ